MIAEGNSAENNISPLRSRERLAWAILSFAFVLLLAVLLLIPALAGAFVQRSTRPLMLSTFGTNGTVLESTTNDILEPDESPMQLKRTSGLRTTTNQARGVIETYHPDTDALMARVEALGNTNVEIDNANMPRFGRSNSEPHLFITLKQGRMRLTIPSTETDPQPLIAYVSTPHGQAAIDKPGQYTLENVGGIMQVSVFEGHAWLRAADNELQLVTDERGTLDNTGIPLGPFATARNLIANGDFSDSLSSWTPFDWEIERADQPSGVREIVDVNGEPTLRFSRFGEGNARNELRQNIDRNVSDFNDLRLVIGLRIREQSLEVCGFRGTECPLTVRLNYRDINGQPWAWEQGFYASGTVDSATAPDVCTGCGFPISQFEHRRIPQREGGELVVEYTDNLLILLEQEGIRPTYIDSVTLIAEGHTFLVEVNELSLLANEELQDQSILPPAEVGQSR